MSQIESNWIYFAWLKYRLPNGPNVTGARKTWYTYLLTKPTPYLQRTVLQKHFAYAPPPQSAIPPPLDISTAAQMKYWGLTIDAQSSGGRKSWYIGLHPKATACWKIELFQNPHHTAPLPPLERKDEATPPASTSEASNWWVPTKKLIRWKIVCFCPPLLKSRATLIGDGTGMCTVIQSHSTSQHGQILPLLVLPKKIFVVSLTLHRI